MSEIRAAVSVTLALVCAAALPALAVAALLYAALAPRPTGASS